MALGNINLGSVPAGSGVITNATLWSLLSTGSLGTGSRTLVSQLNQNLYDIKTGITILPRTVVMVNGIPKTLTNGNLTISLSDLGDSITFTQANTKFAANSYVTTKFGEITAAIADAKNSRSTYSNVSVADYMPTYLPGYLSTYLPTYLTTNLPTQLSSYSGNINQAVPMTSTVARKTWVSTKAPKSSDGSIGDIWYQTY